MFARALIVSLALLLAGGCTESATTAPTANGTNDQPENAISQPVQDASPNYAEREGDTYMYVSEVSEEERQKGRATGTVVMYTYLGAEDGKHLIASVDEAGNITGRNECSDPCRIIKSTYGGDVERIPYNERSVIGSAFADALAGRLAVAKKKPRQRQGSPSKGHGAAEIPVAFRGEWNADLSARGTGLNDSRLQIGASKLEFYESTGAVKSVRVENWRVINVTADFSGEGQDWERTVRLALTGPGDGVSVDDDTMLRRRCPT